MENMYGNIVFIQKGRKLHWIINTPFLVYEKVCGKVEKVSKKWKVSLRC